MTPVTFRRALGLGAGTAFLRAAPPLLVALAAVAGSCTATLLWTAGLGWLADRSASLLLPGLLAAALAAWVLEAAVLGGAVLQASASLRGAEVPGLLLAVRAAAPRALGWAALAAAALIAWNGWELGLVGAGLLLYLRGLLLGTGGLLGALGLALAAVLGPLGAVFLQLVAEMALVRSVARDEPPAVAGWEAARALLDRPWAPLGLWALTGLVAAAVAGTAAAVSSMGPPLVGRYSDAMTLVGVAISALAGAVAQLVRLGAFAALELGRTGELPPAPEPPRPPPVPRAELVPDAEPVLEARAVGPGAGASG